MDSKFFSREAKTQRRLDRLQKIADGFATSHMLPGNDEKVLDRRELPQQAISLVSDFLSQFIWPLPPQLTYHGLRMATRDENTPAIDADAQVIISARVVTNSGCRKEVEIPIFVRENQLLEPAVMIVDGIPRIIAQSLVDEIVKPRTFKQKIDPRGGLFAPPMDQEARQFYLSMPDELKVQDRYNRGMFSVAEKRTAQDPDDDLDQPSGSVEIAYYIPGKGSWKRKQFDSQQKAEAWVEKLREKEGDDVEVRWERTSSIRHKQAAAIAYMSRNKWNSLDHETQSQYRERWDALSPSEQEEVTRKYQDHGNLPYWLTDEEVDRLFGMRGEGRGWWDAMSSEEQEKYLRDAPHPPMTNEYWWEKQSPEERLRYLEEMDFPRRGSSKRVSQEQSHIVDTDSGTTLCESGQGGVDIGEFAEQTDFQGNPKQFELWCPDCVAVYKALQFVNRSTKRRAQDEPAPPPSMLVDLDADQLNTLLHYWQRKEDDPKAQQIIPWIEQALQQKQARVAALKPGYEIRLLDDPGPFFVVPNTNQRAYFYYKKDEEFTVKEMDKNGRPVIESQDGSRAALVEEEGGYEPVQPTLPGIASRQAQARRAQRYDPGTRVTVSGNPARVLEQIHEPTGNGAFDGTYRVEFLDGKTDVVPESKVKLDKDLQTERHMEASGASWPMPGEEVMQTPTGRWQYIWDADDKEPKYYHLDCDGYAGQDGDCELCGAPSPSSTRYETVGKGVYGPRSGAREGDGQPAEHNRDRKDDDFTPGQKVTFSQAYRDRTRGGPSYLIEKGTGVTIVRDVFEDGTSFEVRLENGTKVIVPNEVLKQAGKPSVDQVLREVEAMKSDGYSDLDISLAVRRKYPSVGEAAIHAAKERKLLDV